MSVIAIVGRFVSKQAVIQIIDVMCGLLIVRLLEKQEYAYYTIANSMVGIMAALANNGITFGLSSIGSGVWQDARRFGGLINTGLALRRVIMIIVAIVTCPILYWMLTSHGASLSYAGMLLLMVWFDAELRITNGILNVVPWLTSKVEQIQAACLIHKMVRVLCLGAAWAVLFNTGAVLAAAAIASAFELAYRRRLAAAVVDLEAAPVPEDRVAIIAVVRGQVANGIFYCLQGPLTIWLISIFGQTQSVADLGALGRLALIFSFASTVIFNLMLPDVTRSSAPRVLRDGYLKIMLVGAIFSLFIIAGSSVLARQFLWLLGPRYSGLEGEVVLVACVNALSFMSALMWAINASKAWLEHSWVHIPLMIVTQVILLRLMDVGTLHGVLLFGLYSAAPGLLINTWLGFRGLRAAAQKAA